jgi:hypothetical protein
MDALCVSTPSSSAAFRLLGNTRDVIFAFFGKMVDLDEFKPT